MNQYLLLNRIEVQNANAIAGFTWGFPAITHFLGFSHNLSRKLHKAGFDGIDLSGCAVIAHQHKVHTYGPSYAVGFTQSRNPPYLASHDKASTPPVIEEGKMNMTVSLLIACNGNIGNRQDAFLKWLEKTCFLQRLAGGTILKIGSVELCNIDDDIALRSLKRKLLPGFVLKDRADYLIDHFKQLRQDDNEAELLNAWLDFVALKQKARPQSDLISQHLINMVKNNVDENLSELLTVWNRHLSSPYQENEVPELLKHYFENLDRNEPSKKLLEQWSNYCSPTEETMADWQYVPKPNTGYLVPIMIGYKAISELYQNHEVDNTRDNETPVCFVESAHSIGEWLSIHRLKTAQAISESVWYYHHEEHWYLCKQEKLNHADTTEDEIVTENPNSDFY
ncbi:MAG: type I-F CRISPR-associated protein Csy2 [Methyloprofundus sp.]|nr:type I-F CRISPR-associated protein Csy2 [Methyloprofundus sp.]MBW6453089.1 type I-F CRISPR-associated protein Csy2 [Methyloprofundus sp.]